MDRMSMITEDIQAHWAALSPLFVIRNESDYDEAIERLNELLDEIGDDEQHPLYDLLDTLGTVIFAYEEKHYPVPECDGVEALHFFIEEHNLGKHEFPELGTSDTVSRILDGKQELTVRQIRFLAKRFQVTPSTFV